MQSPHPERAAVGRLRATRSKGVRGRLCAVGLLALFLLPCPGARALDCSSEPGGPDASDTEYKVKAASLYHFIRYTTWPEGSFEDERSPIAVLVVGGNPFGKHLEAALAGKLVGKRAIHLSFAAEVPEQIQAHVVFAGTLSGEDRARLLAISLGRPCLLFGDRPGYARSGACGNFFLEKGKVGFEINVDALKAAHLEISSQVLKLARIVRNSREEER